MTTVTDMTYDREAISSSAWAAIFCMSLLTFLLVALEFLPASLLTPIAQDLGISEGLAGQAITASGLFAVLTSLFGNTLLRSMDRRNVTLLYSCVLVLSSLIVAFAPNFPVFLLGRALVGIAIGGFWSLSTALLARLATPKDLPKAITLLQGGTALAIVLAAPLGSFLGYFIGWRGTFLVTVPIGALALIWQLVALPKIPPVGAASTRSMIALLYNPKFALGMAATALVFMGMNSLSIYLRPFLETVTDLHFETLSFALLSIGVGGVVGLAVVGLFLGRHLGLTLAGLPAALAVFAVLLIALGHYAVPTIVILFLWGLVNSPVPAAWNTWMARIIPHQLEAGGGLQVALIQASIAGGAIAGGIAFDSIGWWGAFVLATLLLVASAILGSLAMPGSKR